MPERLVSYEQGDLGGLDDCGHLIALLQAHFFGASLGDNRLDDIVADLHSDEGRHGPENYLGDFTLQMITSTECHKFFSLRSVCSERDLQLRLKDAFVRPVSGDLGCTGPAIEVCVGIVEPPLDVVAQVPVDAQRKLGRSSR